MSRNGFASLLALIILAVASTLAAGALSAVHASTRRALLVEARWGAEDLVSSAELVACNWLDKNATEITLPADGGLLLLCDTNWQDDANRPHRLAVALLDVHAALPRSALTPGDPLRLALASPGTAPSLRVDPATIPAADLLGIVDLPSGWSRIPNHIPQGRPIGSALPMDACADGVPLASWFAPDNDGQINANTAPATILRAACAGSGLDAEAILALRRAGARWPGPANTVGGGVQVVPASKQWHILIVAEHAGTQVVRWAVADGTAGPTRIIRRHHATPRATPTFDP